MSSLKNLAFVVSFKHEDFCPCRLAARTTAKACLRTIIPRNRLVIVLFYLSSDLAFLMITDTETFLIKGGANC